MSVKINLPLIKKFEKQVDNALDIASLFLAEEMQKTANGDRGVYLQAVDTGNFRNSFDWRRKNSDTNEIFNDSEYAIYIEFGTVNMRPRPIMRTTATANKKNIENIFKSEINV